MDGDRQPDTQTDQMDSKETDRQKERREVGVTEIAGVLSPPSRP